MTISALAPLARADAVAHAMLRETTSLGVRRYAVARLERPRTVEHVETPYGRIPVKVATGPFGPPQMKPEFDACARPPRAHGVPVREVLRVAMAAAGCASALRARATRGAVTRQPVRSLRARTFPRDFVMLAGARPSPRRGMARRRHEGNTMSACSQCGTVAKATDKFCNVCGTPLARDRRVERAGPQGAPRRNMLPRRPPDRAARLRRRRRPLRAARRAPADGPLPDGSRDRARGELLRPGPPDCARPDAVRQRRVRRAAPPQGFGQPPAAAACGGAPPPPAGATALRPPHRPLCAHRRGATLRSPAAAAPYAPPGRPFGRPPAALRRAAAPGATRPSPAYTPAPPGRLRGCRRRADAASSTTPPRAAPPRSCAASWWRTAPTRTAISGR